MKTNFKKRLLISAGVIVVTVIVAAIALFYLAGTLDASAAKVVSQRAAAQASAADLGRLAELEQDAPQAATYQTAIDTLLPTTAGLIDIPPTVAALATADGATATFSFQGNPSAPAPGTLGTVAFSIDAQGSLDQITAFLTDLETKTSGLLLNLASFELSNGDGSNAHLTGQGTLYFQ